MEFKSVSIVKFEPALPWNALRDHLQQIGKEIPDLDKIVEKERVPINSTTLKVINEWHAKPALPAFVNQHIKHEMLIWTDTALWYEKKRVIEWRIVSKYFNDKMDCSGTTKFEPALGGKGTRITFSGSLQWKRDANLGMGLLDKPLLKVAESVLTQLIPANFRKIANLLETYIQKP